MINKIKVFFAPLKPIEVGSIWALDADNPFMPYKIKIMDIKNGYVLYLLLGTDHQSSQKESTFRSIFK